MTFEKRTVFLRVMGRITMWQDPRDSSVVVDDDQGILDSFDVMLGDDYPLDMVRDANRALAVLAAKKPRLIFLDIKMPGVNGIELLRRLRETGTDAAVVIVTALPQPHYEEMADQYGVYRYLKKPLDVDEVEAITRRVLH